MRPAIRSRQVLRVDEATQKISLGLKQLLDDPWSMVASKYKIGDVLKGPLRASAEFGAFVSWARHRRARPRLDLAARPAWRVEGVGAAGMTGTFEVLSIDTPQKRNRYRACRRRIVARSGRPAIRFRAFAASERHILERGAPPIPARDVLAAGRHRDAAKLSVMKSSA